MNMEQFYQATELKKRLDEMKAFNDILRQDKGGCQPIAVKNGFCGRKYDKMVNLWPEQAAKFRKLFIELEMEMQNELEQMLK